MKTALVRTLSLALVSIGLSVPAAAQDTHYWTQVFGSGSGLLGGTAIGGAHDTSATFYNPGALGFQRPGTLGVSANAYQVQEFEIRDGAGAQLDLDSSEINVIPLAIAGTLGFDAIPGHVFGYSVITRNQSNFEAADRLEVALDVIPELPGDEEIASQVFARSKLTEFWAGISWGYAVLENVSVGATFFGALRDQSQGASARLLAVGQGQAASSTLLEDLSYINVRGLFKFGVAGQWEHVDAGLTLTTPSFDMYGDGEVAGELSGLVAVEGATESLVLADRESGLDASFKSPLSIAFGLEVRPVDRLRLTGAFEWFDSISEYVVVEPESGDDVLTDTDGLAGLGEDLFRVTDAAQSIINFGFGASYAINDAIAGYASYRMDRSYRPEDRFEGLGISTWDVQHVIAGGTYRLESSELAIGVQYSFGDGPARQFVDASGDASVPDLPILIGPGDQVNGDYQALTVLVGYTQYFE